MHNERFDARLIETSTTVMKTLINISRICVVAVALATASQAFADRVKDIASAAAVRSNHLIGYGLVVGLQGTGDGA